MILGRPVFRRAVLCLAGGLAATLGAEGVGAYIRARIFQPGRMPLAPMRVDGIAFDLLTVARPDGTTLSGLVARASDRKAVVLFLHGNGGNAALGAARAAGLVHAGYDLVVADYRGYGGNTGTPSEAGLVEDATAFLDEARRIAGDCPLLLVGHSLGGAVAILIAGTAPIAGLLTLGAVARVSDLVPVIGRPFLSDGFDALAVASRVGVPWIVAHGEADDVVPASDAVRLAGVPPAAGRDLRLLPGLGHAPDPAMLRALVDRLHAWVTAGRRREARQAAGRDGRQRSRWLPLDEPDADSAREGAQRGPAVPRRMEPPAR